MRCRQSARLTPAAAIRINTSPPRGSGTGRLAGTNISGPPGALIWMTVWVAGMLASIEILSFAGRPRYYSRAGTIVSCSAQRCGRRDMPILQDKVVLVTGAGAGIGRATTLAMAEAGAMVAAADIDPAAARRTADQIASNTRRALAIEADCGDLESIDAMVGRTVTEFGRLDVIVNNAGVTRFAYLMDLTEADWDRIHRVNAKGVFFCLQRAAREMIRQNQTHRS